jgi:N-acetyl-alpha-D-muramate 1-phosphate uridylyltransferase
VSAVPKSAMVLAAGLGTRLRPLSDTQPKPMVEIAGRTLLDHAIDRLQLVGVERVVVNVHYKGDQIVDHLGKRKRPKIIFSREETLLDTGGGVARALPWLDEVFFVVNGDVMWFDGAAYALTRLAQAFEPERMDAVLLFQRTANAVGYEGDGDFFLDPLGTPRRRREREIAPYIFAGIRILHRRLFDGVTDAVFSVNRLFDKAIATGRLSAIVHDGEWYHVSTPDGLAQTRERLASHRTLR